MTTRNLDPELAPILAAIEGGGMFDDDIAYPAMRERFEETAPLMWDAGKLPVHETVDRVSVIALTLECVEHREEVARPCDH